MQNWIGVVGAFIAHHGYLMLGVGVWVILASAGAYLAVLAWRGPVSHPVIRAVGVVIGPDKTSLLMADDVGNVIWRVTGA